MPKFRQKAPMAGPKVRNKSWVPRGAIRAAKESGEFLREGDLPKEKNAVRYARERVERAARMGGAAVLRPAAAVVVKLAKAALGAIAAAGGGAIAVFLLLGVGLLAAIAASPFGIFLARESNVPGTISLEAAVAQIDREYAQTIALLSEGDYDTVYVLGQPARWQEVTAVFACKTAGGQDGMDVAALDAHRVELLRQVFWDMTVIETTVEDMAIPESDPDGQPDDSKTESVLTIAVCARSAGDMAAIYGFDEDQVQLMTDLLGLFDR